MKDLVAKAQHVAELEHLRERDKAFAKLETELPSLLAINDCVSILIERLKELKEHETLNRWDTARARCEAKARRGYGK